MRTSLTELELYKFCQNKEMDWRDEELVIWLNFYDLDEFTKLIGYDYFSDGGIEANFQYDNLAFDLVPICEYWGIEPTHILNKED
jgi:hypothetical protein